MKLKTLANFDVSFVQGIGDATGKYFPKLVDLLNTRAGAKHFNYTVSPRYGKTSRKEQYGVIYEYDFV